MNSTEAECIAILTDESETAGDLIDFIFRKLRIPSCQIVKRLIQIFAIADDKPVVIPFHEMVEPDDLIETPG